jgi:hypothetical protein
MTYFVKKTQDICLNEIKAASEYVSQMFNSEINLVRLKDQVDHLVDEKIQRYYHERFKDWTVADLILLAETIEQKIVAESKADSKSRKTKVGQAD